MTLVYATFHTHTGPEVACNGGIGSLVVLPLKARRGKKLTGTQIALFTLYPVRISVEQSSSWEGTCRLDSKKIPRL